MSEKVTVRVERNILHLPAIALRGLVVFPNNLLHFEVGREKSIAAVEWAVSNHSNVFLIAQKDMKADDPAADHDHFAARLTVHAAHAVHVWTIGPAPPSPSEPGTHRLTWGYSQETGRPESAGAVGPLGSAS